MHISPQLAFARPLGVVDGFASKTPLIGSGKPQGERESSNKNGGNGSQQSTVGVNGGDFTHEESGRVILRAGLFLAAIGALAVGCALLVRGR